MNKNKLYLGVDPGPVNTGWCVRGVINDKPFLATGVFDPRATGDVIMAAEKLWYLMYDSGPESAEWEIVGACIERYVSYKGVLTSNAEDTCLFIGSLTYLLRSRGITTTLARAITWKPNVCKTLYLSNGFKNPSDKLDKKFSVAAACSILGIEDPKKKPFKTDHEADAIGLSFYAEHQHDRKTNL